jgi:hypothetical protein
MRRGFARLFYRLFARFGEMPLPEGAGDFRLIDRKGQLGRVLQVGIHDHHGAALGMVEPGRDGDLLAEVAASRRCWSG